MGFVGTAARAALLSSDGDAGRALTQLLRVGACTAPAAAGHRLYETCISAARLGLTLVGAGPTTVEVLAGDAGAAAREAGVESGSALVRLQDAYVFEWGHSLCKNKVAASGRPLRLTLCRPPAPGNGQVRGQGRRGPELEPNVGPAEPTSSFAARFGATAALRAKARQLSERHGYHRWRRVRGDGNCYYRAVGVQLLEHVLRPGNDEALLRVLSLFENVDYTRGAEQEGGEAFYAAALSDQHAHGALTQRLRDAAAGKGWDGTGGRGREREHEPEPGALASAVSERVCATMQRGDDDGGRAGDDDGDMFDQAMVRALRRLTADYLLEHRHDSTAEGGLTFEQLVVAQGQGESVEDFCGSVVLRMGIEAEGIVLQALPLQLGVGSRIAFVDKREGSAVEAVDYPAEAPRGGRPLHLLLQPGHYDILYHGGAFRPRSESGPLTVLVQAPFGVRPGGTHRYRIAGRTYPVTIPHDVLPGNMFPFRAVPTTKEQEERAQLERAMEASRQEASRANKRIGGGVHINASSPASSPMGAIGASSNARAAGIPAAAPSARPPASPVAPAATATTAAPPLQAGDDITAFNPIAERWCDGQVVAVLGAGTADHRVRVSFDMQAAPPAFVPIQEGLVQGGQFWQGEPALLVGAQVEVRWRVGGERLEWFRGLVTAFAAGEMDPHMAQMEHNRAALNEIMGSAEGMHHISYHDDTQGRHNLSARAFRVLSSDHTMPHDSDQIKRRGSVAQCADSL
eukprot:g7974.t1